MFDLTKYRGVIFHDTEEWCEIWRKTDFWFGKYILFWAKNVQGNNLSWNWRPIQNLERNWLIVSKLVNGISQILTWVLKSLKDFHFTGLLLSKLCIVWAKKVQRSYLSWHWRVMQNLKKKCLVAWKMTWGILQIFTRALESVKIGTSQILTWALEKSKKKFLFNWLLVTKVYIVWATKVQRSYLSLHWGVIQILKKDWPVVWKDMRNLANFHQGTWKCQN